MPELADGGGNPIKELGLIYSRFCNAACAHCGSSSGPAAKGKMPMRYVEHSVADAAEAGVSSLIVSGGEPMAFVADMCQLAEMAHDHGVALHLCSNAYWGDRPERARAWLEALAERGLELLLLSTDQWHLSYVPLASVVTAANVAAELGIPCQVAVPAAARDWTATRILTTLQRETSADVYTHPVHPVGRGEELAAHHFRWQPLRVGPCHLVGHVEVDYEGTVSVCPTSADFDRTSPLILGNVAEARLGELLARFRATPLYRVIAQWGPLGLHALVNGTVETAGLGLGDRLHDCHLCRHLTRDDTAVRRYAQRTGVDLLEPVDAQGFAAIAERVRHELARLTAGDGARGDAVPGEASEDPAAEAAPSGPLAPAAASPAQPPPGRRLLPMAEP